jgi:hypothetical protein
MAAYIGSSFTGVLPAVATAATMHHGKIGGGEQQGFARAEPYAISRNGTIQSLTLVGPGSCSLGDQARSVSAVFKLMP